MSTTMGASSNVLAESNVPSEASVEGVVKWFNRQRQYGYITPKDGSQDIRLNASVLKAGGFETPGAGATIVILKKARPCGFTASSVLSLDRTTEYPEGPKKPTKQVEVVNIGDFVQVTVKRVLPGFLFVTRGNGSEDIMVHFSTFRSCKVNKYAKKRGDPLEVRYGRGPKGLIAVEVRMPK